MEWQKNNTFWDYFNFLNFLIFGIFSGFFNLPGIVWDWYTRLFPENLMEFKMGFSWDFFKKASSGPDLAPSSRYLEIA